MCTSLPRCSIEALTGTGHIKISKQPGSMVPTPQTMKHESGRVCSGTGNMKKSKKPGSLISTRFYTLNRETRKPYRESSSEPSVEPSDIATKRRSSYMPKASMGLLFANGCRRFISTYDARNSTF